MSTDSSLCCRWCGKCIGLVRCVAVPRPGVSGRLLPERTTEQMSLRRFHFVRISFFASRDAASHSSRQLVRKCSKCSVRVPEFFCLASSRVLLSLLESRVRLSACRASARNGGFRIGSSLPDGALACCTYRLVRFDSVIARASCCRCVALLWPKRAACQGPRRAFSSLCERLKHIEESLAASNFERCRVLATATSHEADIVRLESANATLHAVRSDTPTALNP